MYLTKWGPTKSSARLGCSGSTHDQKFEARMISGSLDEAPPARRRFARESLQPSCQSTQRPGDQWRRSSGGGS
jgi:hypothetical protein